MRYLIEALQSNGNWEPAGDPISDAIVGTKREAELKVLFLVRDWGRPKSYLRIVPVSSPEALLAELETLGYQGYSAAEFAESFQEGKGK